MSATAASPPLTRSSTAAAQDRFGPLASIRTKVYASFACALVLMAILGAFAIYSLVHVNTLAGSIYSNGVVPVETLGQMHAGAGLLNLAVAESLADPGAIRSY